MIADRRFLHQNIKPITIPRARVVTGIVLGLGFAFALYSLLYMGRESLRIFSMTDQFDLWAMTAKEVWFFNLVIAYVAVIFGQSVCFAFWFNFPSMRYGKYKRRHTSVVNDQFNLNTFFLSWISKMAVVWAVFFGWTVFEGYYVIPLYPNYIYIFLLIIIVLFLNSWITLLRIYKKRCWKWLGLSFFCVTVVAFAFSFVNLINYKKINDAVLSNNLQYAYGLELPTIDTDKEYHFMDSRSGFIGMTYNNDSVKLLFRANKPFEKYHEFSLAELIEQVKDSEGYTPREDELFPNTTYYSLLADKRIPMVHINKLKEALRTVGIYKLYYNFVPATYKNNPLYSESGLRIITGANYSPNLFFDDIWRNIYLREKLEIKYISHEHISFNNQPIAYNELKERIQSEVRSIGLNHGLYNKYVIIVYISDSMLYEDYLKILQSCQVAIHEIREEESMAMFGIKLQELEDLAFMDVVRRNPLYILELTEDMIKKYDLKILEY